MQFRLGWLFFAVLCGALLSLYLTNYVFVPEAPKSDFEKIDGVFAVAEYIHVDAPANDRLYFRYHRYADMGVELERVANGKTKWLVHVEPLGVFHSKYKHAVRVTIKGDEIRVRSKGSSGSFYERLNLSNGSSIQRTKTDEHAF